MRLEPAFECHRTIVQYKLNLGAILQLSCSEDVVTLPSIKRNNSDCELRFSKVRASSTLHSPCITVANEIKKGIL